MGTLKYHLERLNTFLGASTFGRVFRLEGCGHVSFASSRQTFVSLTNLKEKEIKNARFTTEIRAGLTTFFTMAYVISVNVQSITQSTLQSTTDCQRLRS